MYLSLSIYIYMMFSLSLYIYMIHHNHIIIITIIIIINIYIYLSLSLSLYIYIYTHMHPFFQSDSSAHRVCCTCSSPLHPLQSLPHTSSIRYVLRSHVHFTAVVAASVSMSCDRRIHCPPQPRSRCHSTACRPGQGHNLSHRSGRYCLRHRISQLETLAARVLETSFP